MVRQDWERVFRLAEEAGRRAWDACAPTPMAVVVGDGLNPGRMWLVSDGPCGFAWVVIRPGTCSAAIWARRNLGRNTWRPRGGGLRIWVPVRFWDGMAGDGQSYERHLAYARAFAAVLQEFGVSAHADGSLD